MARRRTSRGGGRRPAGGGKQRPRKVGAKRQPARTSSARTGKMDEPLVRLNKFLADCGVASRRGCDDLIEAGKVTIDGMPITALGTKVDPAVQVVEVDGYVLRPEHASRQYYLLHKPAGVICTNERREARARAIDLITDKNKGRIYTVGRLDEESTGLILLTNDGEFAQHVAHPRYGVPKTYKVRVQGRIPDEALKKVRQGVHLSEGKTSGARIIVRRRTAKSSILAVTLLEGMNREVRRVFARVGYKVMSLERTDIGPLTLRGLKAGSWRALSREEVEAVLTATGAERPERKSTPRKPKAARQKTGATKKAGTAKGKKKPAKATRKTGRSPKGPDEPPRRRRIVGPK